MNLLIRLSEAFYNGDEKYSIELIKTAIKRGYRSNDILKAMTDGMMMLGNDFSQDKVYIPEILTAWSIMTEGNKLLNPILETNTDYFNKIVVLGSVKGDMHDVGKNLVLMMLQGYGFRVIDLGVNVTKEEFVKAAKKHNADIIGCSAFLTNTMSEIPKIVKKCEEEGMRDQVKIMIGGAPIDQDFCDRSGCDAYAKDAGGAAKVAKALGEKM
jgi:methylmalonyl-CoA mutase cobalamin-binding domain/chain